MASFMTVDMKRDNEAMIRRLTNGTDPFVVDGVRWWHVGDNSSHSFYLGLDGSMAFHQSAVDWCDVDEGYRTPGHRETISFAREINRNRRPVKDGDQLYLGR